MIVTRKRKYEIGEEPWLLRDFWGLPGWGVVLGAGVSVTLAVIIVVLILNPR